MNFALRSLALLTVAAAVALAGPSARADIDPASDVLIYQNVFLPYAPKVCPQLEKPLVELTEQTARAGYPIKVAIIGSQADLGGAAQYFGEPQEYAQFLGNELGISTTHGPGLETNRSLLTVMPDGFGFHRSGKAPDVSEVLDDLPVPGDSHPNELARATITALPKLAIAAERPIPIPNVSSSVCSSGSSSAVIFAVFIGLLILAVAIVGVVARRRAAPSGAE